MTGEDLRESAQAMQAATASPVSHQHGWILDGTTSLRPSGHRSESMRVGPRLSEASGKYSMTDGRLLLLRRLLLAAFFAEPLRPLARRAVAGLWRGCVLGYWTLWCITRVRVQSEISSAPPSKFAVPAATSPHMACCSASGAIRPTRRCQCLAHSRSPG